MTPKLVIFSVREKIPPTTKPMTNPIGLVKKNLSIKFPNHPNNSKDAAIWNPIEDSSSQLDF